MIFFLIIVYVYLFIQIWNSNFVIYNKKMRFNCAALLNVVSILFLSFGKETMTFDHIVKGFEMKREKHGFDITVGVMFFGFSGSIPKTILKRVLHSLKKRLKRMKQYNRKVIINDYKNELDNQNCRMYIDLLLAKFNKMKIPPAVCFKINNIEYCKKTMQFVISKSKCAFRNNWLLERMKRILREYNVYMNDLLWDLGRLGPTNNIDINRYIIRLSQFVYYDNYDNYENHLYFTVNSLIEKIMKMINVHVYGEKNWIDYRYSGYELCYNGYELCGNFMVAEVGKNILPSELSSELDFEICFYMKELISRINNKNVDYMSIVSRMSKDDQRRFCDYLRRCPNSSRLLSWIEYVSCVPIYDETWGDLEIVGCDSTMPCRCKFRECNCNGCEAKEKLNIHLATRDNYYDFLTDPTNTQKDYDNILCEGWNFTD